MTSMIVVRPALLGADPDELLGHLGYEKRRRKKVASFAEAGSASIWVGAIGDRIVIYTFLADQFFDGFLDGPPDQDFIFLKNALLRHFSETDIAAFFIDTRVDGWGFSVFHRGALIRRFYGHDGAILGDEGSPLPAEKACLGNYDRIELDGESLYKRRSAADDEPVSLAYLGSDLFYEVWRSFTGYEFDAPEILQVTGSDFWLNDDEAKFSRRKAAQDEYLRARSRRPWWKLFG